MLLQPVYKFSILLLLTSLVFGVTEATGQTNMSETRVIGPKGGDLLVEDPASGITVSLSISEDALRNDTSITLSVLSSPLPKPFAKTYIKGISVSPKGLFLREEAELRIFNPPGDVSDRILLYCVVNSQFAVPCGGQVVNSEENWISGNIYISGNYCLGSPTKDETLIQFKKLTSYNPAKPFAEMQLKRLKEIQWAENNAGNSPVISNWISLFSPLILPGYYTDATLPEPEALADEDCMRWQKVFVKVEGIMMWVEYAILTGNTQMENEARQDADKTLQEAIDDFLNHPPPLNPCVNHIKAAAKYIEKGTKLGLNVGPGSPIDQRFSGLIDQCAFRFSVEFHEWISHPKETLKDDATYEEKLNRYGTIHCYMPYNQFLTTGESAVKGNGVMTISYDNHWVGYEKNSHETQRGKITASKVEGNVKHWVDDVGQPHLEANITIFWKKEVIIHTWGVGVEQKVFDNTDLDNSEYSESKVFPLVNGEFVNFGNAEAGIKISVFGIKSPGDGRDNPDDCF